jgi:hypothetical protein
MTEERKRELRLRLIDASRRARELALVNAQLAAILLELLEEIVPTDPALERAIDQIDKP